MDGVQKAWLDGALPLATEHEARGRVLALGEVAGTEFASMLRFYGVAPQEGNDKR